jgi:formylglycine-generating enzyme
MTARRWKWAVRGCASRRLSAALAVTLLDGLGCSTTPGNLGRATGGTPGLGQAGRSGEAGASGEAGTGGAPPRSVCGNGAIEDGEACDDGNATPSDGCSESCLVEPGWSCAGLSSVCTPTHPSCVGLAASCSGSNGDCCASSLVTGGTFQRENDLVDSPFAATIDDFRLDTYEVTAGRFARYVAGYPANKPAAGSGKNPRNSTDPGWDPAWNAFLPADRATLTANVQCDSTYQTWGNGDNLAMNCVTWFDANAFCIWDGGRLPTSAEWDYAAAGGSDQRYYPWSNPFTDETIDDSYAVYSPATYVAEVGSKSPKGDAKYGQSDLAGNVWEWVQDWYVPYYTTACDNCAALVPPPDTSERVIRGGSAYDDASYLNTFTVDVYNPTTRINYIGFRCARSR